MPGYVTVSDRCEHVRMVVGVDMT